MNIRTVTPEDDFGKIAAIYAASWQAAYRGIVPQDYLDSLTGGAYWREKLAARTYPALVLVEKGAYLGTSSYSPAREESMAGWGEVISLYLLPEAWGKGWGKALLEEAARQLRTMGLAKIYLWVLEENHRARRFYEGQGFSPWGDGIELEIGGKGLRELRYVREG